MKSQQFRDIASHGSERPEVQSLEPLFDNLPTLLTPKMAADLTHSSIKTVFDWRYRPAKYGVPDDMFVKGGRKLFLRRDLFTRWFFSRVV